MIALDRHAPREIAERIDALGLDRERLWLGVGAGFSKRPYTTMRDALGELRETLPGIRIVLAAMGPRMCALAGASYDGAFFNWMKPDFAAGAREHVHAGARRRAASHRRCSGTSARRSGPDASERLAKEEGFYRELHDGYRRHFERTGEPEGTVGIAVRDREGAVLELADYEEVLDVTVVRGLASASVEAMTALAEAAAPPGE